MKKVTTPIIDLDCYRIGKTTLIVVFNRMSGIAVDKSKAFPIQLYKMDVELESENPSWRTNFPFQFSLAPYLGLGSIWINLPLSGEPAITSYDHVNEVLCDRFLFFLKSALKALCPEFMKRKRPKRDFPDYETVV